jgi:transposase
MDRDEQNKIIVNMWKGGCTIREIRKTLGGHGVSLEESGIKGRVRAMRQKGLLEPRKQNWHANS